MFISLILNIYFYSKGVVFFIQVWDLPDRSNASKNLNPFWNRWLTIFLQDSELTRLTAAREAETKYIKEQNELEILKTRELAVIEADKFKEMVHSIGANTIQAIATSGPEMQVCSI